jgi:hypothetical protein
MSSRAHHRRSHRPITTRCPTIPTLVPSLLRHHSVHHRPSINSSHQAQSLVTCRLPLPTAVVLPHPQIDHLSPPFHQGRSPLSSRLRLLRPQHPHLCSRRAHRNPNAASDGSSLKSRKRMGPTMVTLVLILGTTTTTIRDAMCALLAIRDSTDQAV